jgi:isoquinoline 1-oxidoreductase subunit beta
MNRRQFLIGTALTVGGALTLGMVWSWNRLRTNAAFKLPAAPGQSTFNAWLRIDASGRVTVAVPRQEMGQGISTMLAMFVAEELEVPMTSIQVIEAPIQAVYANTTMLLDGLPTDAAPVVWTMHKVFSIAGIQGTGGSTSTRDGFVPMRTAAASAKQMLIAEAAARWNVAADACRAQAGVIVHAPSGKQATFGELATAAALRAAPASVRLKVPSEWIVLGTSPPRLDVPAKSNGTAQFGIDTVLPNMLFAAVKHIPGVRGTLQAVRWKDGAPPKSVQALATGEDYLVVAADTTWRAMQALQEAELVGGGAGACVTSSEALFARYDQLLTADQGRVYTDHGNAKKTLAAATQRIEARYRVPFQAHATMEPLNCTVHWRESAMEIWLGNQSPTLVRWVAAEASGLPQESITVHTPFLGGGFGRRSDVEVLRQAIAIAKAAKGRPVKLTWTREEDIRHDAYRPAVAARMRAAFDADGRLTAWDHHMAGMSVMFDFTRRIAKPMASTAMADKTNCEGAAELPYALPHFKVSHTQIDEGVPLGFWRSVGNSYNAFFVETFVDELAASRNEDPYQFRRTLLANNPRFLNTLQAAASAAGWVMPRPAGSGRGIAIAESFKSIVAMVVDVSVRGKVVKVDRVVTAVDCGRVLHPHNARAQIEGAVAFALTAALKSQITLQDGIVQQSNFNDFQMLRMDEMPTVDVHFVQSDAALGGIGEVGVPPLAPALGNAIFAATGKRLRALPFVL